MRRQRAHIPVIAISLLLVLAAVALATQVLATEPIRSGEVLSTRDESIWTLIQAKDAAGKEFWIWTAQCVIGEGGKVEVLQATHHDRLKSETMGREFEDAYVVQRLRINGVDVEGMPAHNIPPGCVTVGR